MARNPGPSFREWLDILDHNHTIGFGELQAMAKRIEESRRLTFAQRARLLRRLGDLQIAAANRSSAFTHHDIHTGPAGS